MRFYQIVISPPKDGFVAVPNLNGQPGFSWVKPHANTWTYCSLKQGGTITAPGSVNPAALKVELDIPSGFLHEPIGNAYIKISGVSLQEVAQGSNLNRMNILVYGGMSKGLPLANPDQVGMLCSGQIWQAFGNWIGTEQSLNIYMQAGGSNANSSQTTGFPAGPTTLPSPNTNANPAGIVFQWQAGQPLLVPLVQTLQNAYPAIHHSGGREF
ncbi:hypothetical protein PQR75_06560 [Paraburkholderia fungorum]|uniref:hypothetical protein n=1 Tax=Paraburkholderia fungorum TaxID=134537 RepID=UPI0038BD87B2